MSPSEEETTPAPSAATAAAGTEDDGTAGRDLKALAKEAENTSLSLESVTDGKSERGIPQVKFIDDIGKFAESFNPPASAELLIGAYSDLFSKFKAYEQSLSQKRESTRSNLNVFLGSNSRLQCGMSIPLNRYISTSYDSTAFMASFLLSLISSQA